MYHSNEFPNGHLIYELVYHLHLHFSNIVTNYTSGKFKLNELENNDYNTEDNPLPEKTLSISINKQYSSTDYTFFDSIDFGDKGVMWARSKTSIIRSLYG